MKKVRLFVSVELSEEVRKEISWFLEKLKRAYFPVRWVALENIHITLAFLGWKEKYHVSCIMYHVSRVVEGMKPFGLKLRGIGCFPDFKSPRVVWLGLAGDLQSLARLQKQVSEKLKKTGFGIEERKFIPHLTLGRVERGVRARALHNLGDQIRRMKVEEFRSRILVEKVSLMESKLSREGPEYKEVASIKLKEGLFADYQR